MKTKRSRFLSPEQEYILITMYYMGLFPDKPSVKVSRIVAACVLYFSNHISDSLSEITQMLYNMSHEYKVRGPYVHGEGNMGRYYKDKDGNIIYEFGADMKYVEARLTERGKEYIEKRMRALSHSLRPEFAICKTETIQSPNHFLKQI